MPTLLPWTTVEIGDVDVFSPALPSLVVYTWYVDDEPESSVTYFWRDEATGMVRHELLYVGPVAFEDAVTRAQDEAPKRSVERIHVKHARSRKQPAAATKTARTPRKVAAAPQPKKGASGERTAAKAKSGQGRKTA